MPEFGSMMGWWFFGGWMILLWLVIIGLIIWGVVTLARRAGPRPGDGGSRNALDIAKERYARGEITKEQFEQIKKDLM